MEIKGRINNHLSGSMRQPRRENHLIILPDFSPASGMISFAKSMRLATTWAQFGHVTFAVSPLTPPMAYKRIEKAGFDCAEVSSLRCSEKTVAELQDLLSRTSASSLIVDGSSWNEAAIATLEMDGTTVLWLQDEAIALQPDYFIAASARPIEPKKIASVARRIAIIFDGCENDSMVSSTLNSLDRITNHTFSIDACISSANTQLPLLLDLASASHHTVRIHRDSSRIESLFPGIDIGITNFGRGCLQLAFNAIPMIGILEFSDPPMLKDSLQSAGAIQTVDLTFDEDALSEGVRRLIRNREKRLELSNAAKRQVDGNGHQRIVAKLRGDVMPLRKAS